MKQVRVILVLLVALCWVSLTSSCRSTRTAKIDTTTEEKPGPCRFCGFFNYRAGIHDVCGKVVQLVDAADTLAVSLKSELRHQLRLLSTSAQGSSVCNITIPTWTKLKKSVLKQLPWQQRQQCHLKLPSEDATCAAIVKLMECTFTGISVLFRADACCPYSDKLPELKTSNALKKAADYLASSVPLERRRQLESIKYSIQSFSSRFEDIYRVIEVECYGPQAILIPALGSVLVSEEDNFDETWFTRTTEDDTWYTMTAEDE